MELPLDKDIIKFILFFLLRTQNDVVNKMALQGQKHARFLSPEEEKQPFGPKESHFSPAFLVLRYLSSTESRLCWLLLQTSNKYLYSGGLRSWKRIQFLGEETCSLFLFLKEEGECDDVFLSRYHFAPCLS